MFLQIIYKITGAPTNQTAAIYLTGTYVIRSNNRASRPPSWYLPQCEASQLEAEMSDEENENNTDIEATIAAGATLSSTVKASISRSLMINKTMPQRTTLACIASISARVRRENWDESKKKRNESNFLAITRLETLATQAEDYLEASVMIKVYNLFALLYLIVIR